MSTLSRVSSEKQATAREQPFNEFLFKILNSLDYAEFKKFSNFPQVLKETIKLIMGSDADLYTLKDRIRYDFETNLSNVDNWHRGLFSQVVLTTEFYWSDAAKRIFEYDYGIKECVVRLVLPTESRLLLEILRILKSGFTN
ncbi:uncharacterized protein LOC119079479 [Bradysia coprophila]|uniref:uncharacterized protein LOC119079479 n=1 Tax=Bradysia coprophila TaxID=38358 RepID=UPI00187DCECC|nr:uncharacterized protein LOC119079479 [Bradysia coprophila]